MPPLSATAGENVPKDLKLLYANTEQSHINRGDLKSYLLQYTDLQFPSNHPNDYDIYNCLKSGLDLLTFDGVDEKKPMGIVAGSYPAFRGK